MPVVPIPDNMYVSNKKKLISTSVPAGRYPLKQKAGLLTYPFYHAFPILDQWQRVR